MKISKQAREDYQIICPTSTAKCESYAELDYKIQRCFDLGMFYNHNENEIHILYYNLTIVADPKRHVITGIKKSEHYNYFPCIRKRKDFLRQKKSENCGLILHIRGE